MVAIKILAMTSSTEHVVYHSFFVGTVMGALIRMGKGTTRKIQNKITIIYLTEMKGENCRANSRRKQTSLIWISATYTGGRESKALLCVCLFLSLLPSPLLWVCCGEEKGRRARTNTNKSCCQLLHSLGSHH